MIRGELFYEIQDQIVHVRATLLIAPKQRERRLGECVSNIMHIRRVHVVRSEITSLY